MADGKKDFVIPQKVATTVSVHAGGIGNIVAIPLQPANHGILSYKQRTKEGTTTRDIGAIIADFVGAPCWRADVEAVSSLAVVGLPGGIRSLENKV